jgi:uncharacterized repeat protein (TIGR03803 family)
MGAIIHTSFSGQPSVLYSFCPQANCADGWYPVGMFQAPDGTIYGTAGGGGANGQGAIYQLSPQGKETVLYSFCSEPNCADGSEPAAAVPSLRWTLLGDAFSGGAYNQGLLFELTPAGEFTPLYSLCAQTGCTDGAGPVAPPIQGSDGTIYGTTNWGGRFGSGTVYAFTPQGHLVTMHSFSSANGASSAPTLTQGADGNFYGVTIDRGSAYQGSVFKITPQGQFTTLYSFCAQKGNCPDGAAPLSLIQGSDGNFYGTTLGGPNGGGTIFEVTPLGVLTTLYSFCQVAGCLDGDSPQSLVQDTNGTFYGTTGAGGTLGGGTLFSLSVGLRPFVQTNPPWGNVGEIVGILGNHLKGTTSVTVNGTTAAFTVVSDTYLKVTVPNGATTGNIAVTTPAGTLASNFPFQVLP